MWWLLICSGLSLRDRRADLDFLVRAKDVTAKIGSPTLQREIDQQLARVVLERDDVLEVVEGGADQERNGYWRGVNEYTAVHVSAQEFTCLKG